MGVGKSIKQELGKERVFISPAFFLMRTSRKDTLKKFETAIKMALPYLKGYIKRFTPVFELIKARKER